VGITNPTSINLLQEVLVLIQYIVAYVRYKQLAPGRILYQIIINNETCQSSSFGMGLERGAVLSLLLDWRIKKRFVVSIFVFVQWKKKELWYRRPFCQGRKKVAADEDFLEITYVRCNTFYFLKSKVLLTEILFQNPLV
jgi:hypothetical protein